MAFLEGLSAADLGLFVNGLDFAATQDMTEEFRQTVAFHGGFGTDGPLLRTVRAADEDTVAFSAILLKRGVQRGLNDEEVLKTLRDFEIMTRRGEKTNVYVMCNWTRISVNSTRDQVVLTCDISVPGFSTG